MTWQTCLLDQCNVVYLALQTNTIECLPRIFAILFKLIVRNALPLALPLAIATVLHSVAAACETFVDIHNRHMSNEGLSYLNFLT